ncbi:Zn-ribbon domain-containing OB-fold protein [Rhodococcus sp. NPDC003318]|uniref:Zn-ribbon domain-containing OB-fold protein n=1 Tax=Rhodococcus sp. NPDC003318 TaxID=3364503 RepID=UPI003697A6D6
MVDTTDVVEIENVRAVPDHAPPRDLVELQPFWDAVDEGRLALPRCPECAVWQWYPGPGCRCGFGGDFHWTEVRGTGVLYTFTRVERAFLPGGSVLPYTVALVDLDEAPGVRLVTDLVGPGSAAPRIGARVTLSPTVFDNHTLPTFALVDDEHEAVPR